MTPEQLVYWLNGFFELSGATTLNEQQVKVIKEHIALVLTKVTPTIVQPYVDPYTYPNVPLNVKGWEVTCQVKEPSLTITNEMAQDLKTFTGVDLNLPTCECHGTGKQEQLPIVNVKTCLSC